MRQNTNYHVLTAIELYQSSYMKKHLWMLVLTGIAGNTLFAQTTPAPFTELFCPVDTAWQGQTLLVPQGSLHYNILLQEGDMAQNLETGTSAPVKGGFGGLFYDRDVRQNVTVNGTDFLKNTEGWLYLSLQDNKTSSTGDGGGYLRLRVKQNAGNAWEVVPQASGSTTFNCRAFDLNELGGTYRSNGIHLGYSALSAVVESSTKGNIFMYDSWAESNADLASGFSNTNNYVLPAASPQPGLSMPLYKNMGWVIEINKQTGLPVKKLYHAGRANIGGLRVTSQKTGSLPAEANYDKNLVFTTRTQPAVIIKYELSGNKVYAYKQQEGSTAGSWKLLNEEDVDGSLFPLSFDQLSDIRKLALQKGATMFNNLGAIEKSDNGNYYIAETGGEAPSGTFTDPAIVYSGSLAHHLDSKVSADGSSDDYYGRILKMYSNSQGNIIVEPYLQGGVTADGRYTFSNPEKLWVYNFNYAPSGGGAPLAHYLVISETVPDAGHKRNPSGTSTENLMNEIYFLNTDISNPDLSNLRPFAIGPKGATVQTAFSVEGPSPLFLSIRYPNPVATSAPYNKSLLIAVNNFEDYFTNPVACGWVVPPPGTDTSSTTTIGEVPATGKDDFKIWPNPVSRTLYFADRQKELKLFDINGRLLKEASQVKELDIFDLNPGVYLLRNEKGQVKKIVIQ